MAQATVARPACDWDTPPNPTFDVWTTVNLAEVFPGVAFPFDASWYHRWQTWKYLDRARKVFEIEDLLPLYEWPIPNFLGFFAGQCAANVGLTTALVSAWQVDGSSAAVEQFFTADKPGGAAAEASTDPERAMRARAKFFRILAQIPRASLTDRAKTLALTDQVAATDLSRLSAATLRRWLERVEVMAAQMFFHHGLVSLGAAEYSTIFAQKLTEWVPDIEDMATQTLTSGLGEVESARPMRALWDLSRWVRGNPDLGKGIHEMPPDKLRAQLDNPPSAAWRELAVRFADFIAEFGFRGPTEWMLALPDWREDPTFPLNSLRNMVAAPDNQSPDHLHETVSNHRREAEQRIRAAVPQANRREFDELLAKSQAFVRLREFTKANCIRGIRPGRRIMLALGDKLREEGAIASRDDIFFLLAKEVDAALKGDLADSKATVERRRKQKKHLEGGFVLPDNFSGEPEIVRREETHEAIARDLSGLAVSPGVATGPARVVMDIDDASSVSMEPGEVLVAPFTDAPWTPLFLLASAVVVETGGMLSHAATVAREFGIPAVVMVKEATHLIQTGQMLTVDGTAGRVTVA